MNYARYFKTGQKVTIRITVGKGDDAKRFDSLFAVAVLCEGGLLEISFPSPYDHDADFPFVAGQEIEVLSEHQGMGVSVFTEFVKRSDAGNAQLKLLGDLEYFNRRRHHRIDADVWLGVEVDDDSIAVMRGKWQQMVEHFRGDNPSPHLTDFSKRKISLSSNGLGLSAETPLKIGSHLMLFLALADEMPTICILGEIVRSAGTEKGTFDVGVHFDCIEEDDRQRIEKYVNQLRRKDD